MNRKSHKVHALEINADMIGALFTDRVEGRLRVFCFYLNGDSLHSYTLLATPGDVLPSLNVEIYGLPWKTVWASQEAEVLRSSGARKAAHCYAVRSPVNDVEAPALYRSSNVFVNPQSVPESFSRPHPWANGLTASTEKRP